MKTIQEIFEDFYQKHLRRIDKNKKIRESLDKKNYQFVLGYLSARKIPCSSDVLGAAFYLNFKLLSSRQKGCEGERLFKMDYEKFTGKDSLVKMSRGNQNQQNPDYFEKNKKIYLEIKTGTISRKNGFIFQQIRLNDCRIGYYIFLGITPKGRFYLVLNKRNMTSGQKICGATLSRQHSTKGKNATYQWHPSYENVKTHIVKPHQLGFSIK